MTQKVLILGAGYAGMMTASRLERLSTEFTLINKNPYHYFTTLLHEVAGGRSTPSNYSVPLTDVLDKPTTHISIDEVTSINRRERTVQLRSGQNEPYDFLVITVGSVPEYFGIPGLAENSLVLNTLDSATRIHQHFEEQMEAYTQDGDMRHLRIVVGGGGLTGIELLGELLDLIPELCARYGITEQKIDLQTIEAASEILPQIPNRLRSKAVGLLTQKGATLHVNTRITEVTAGCVHLGDNQMIEAGTIIWTGGVRANPLLTDAGFTADRRGRAKVNQFLQSVDDHHVFVGGDSAWCDGENGTPLPPTAQMASQMGHVIADNVVALISGNAMTTFRARSLGTLASLGREVGVGTVLGVPVHGVIGGLFKESSKLKYLWELGGIRLVEKKANQVI
ncbi:NAD(P)/FAD-dependent oxidoreductase [Alicyclobacillus mengziensis]|uniref:NAD(P)/FAD-dependent oxidoreductase n=1 Tax=Alicyclobacillus mengziensis TaxID=2931921 RepID=A0A9X7VXE5_9BACL|nr:NAD(P)/FAD-dependent oxidoreductase [Alicyclobacillus mengziensis]QSO46642.1 NAD(P)/FAD-dependent oxidoreductase [Alicyclobacillus mengziensis]